MEFLKLNDMKKYASIILLVICSLGVLSANSQTLEKLYHSKKVDSIVAVVDSVLRSNATWVNGLPKTIAKDYCNPEKAIFHVDRMAPLDSMVYVPIYCNVTFYGDQPVDTLTKEYFLSWRFLEDLDSLAKQGKNFYEQPRIYMYDYFNRVMYEVKGWSIRDEIVKCSLECVLYMDAEFYKFLGEMYYSGRVDFVFGYPLIWEPGYCYSPFLCYFSVKNEKLYLISVDEKFHPFIFQFDEYIECNWDNMNFQ